MNQYQLFLQKLFIDGTAVKNSDGVIGLSLQTYQLEYQVEKTRKRKVVGKPSELGLPLITTTPALTLEKALNKISSLPISEFEEFNRDVQGFSKKTNVVGSYRIGKVMKLPFLKKSDDFRTPSCKIFEHSNETQNKLDNLNLEMSLYHQEIIDELPVILDTVTILFCTLSIIYNFSPNKIVFNLIRPFCRDTNICLLEKSDVFKSHFTALRIKPKVTSFLSIKKGDIEFSVWKLKRMSLLVLFLKKLTRVISTRVSAMKKITNDLLPITAKKI